MFNNNTDQKEYTDEQLNKIKEFVRKTTLTEMVTYIAHFIHKKHSDDIEGSIQSFLTGKNSPLVMKVLTSLNFDSLEEMYEAKDEKNSGVFLTFSKLWAQELQMVLLDLDPNRIESDALKITKLTLLLENEPVKHFSESLNVNSSFENTVAGNSLGLACEFGKLNIVKFLVEKQGADILQKDSNGKTAIDHAKRYPAITEYLEQALDAKDDSNLNVNGTKANKTSNKQKLSF